MWFIVQVTSIMKLALYLLVLVLAIPSGYAINCYQCKSTDLDNPFQCNEYFADSDLQPLPCDSVYNAAFCIKQTGRFEGGLGTKRYCSSLDLGNYCNYIQQPGDALDYRSCVYTCNTDGCNNSNSITFNLKNLIFLLLFIYITHSFWL